MSGPYRDSGGEEQSDAPRDEGIVGDVIAQFADIYAFYRELVQNSIDAGTPSVEIELTYEEAEQRMHVAVKDRGEGMTRDIIENQLLVLFRSTKEKDGSKIGKFGIGFASVLAPNPQVVTVQSARDGRRLTLHLYRDLNYELFDAGPASLAGTTVELQLAMQPKEVPKFVADSLQALHRWCRHASVPIEVVENQAGGIKKKTRIDAPLSLISTLVQVTATADDGQLTVVVGIGPPYVGFFNHGLMLHETTERLVGDLSVKIQDSRLGHTLSRDDVRRDEHFDHALEFARHVAKTKLAFAASVKLQELAENGDVEKVEELFSAIVDAELTDEPLHLPLVEPIREQKSIDIRFSQRAWATTRSTPLTKELAKSLQPVIRCSNVAALAADVERATSCKLREVQAELTCITPVECTERDEALVGTLFEILEKVYRDPGRIVLAELVGFHSQRLTIAGESTRSHVVDTDLAAKNPFSLLARRPLILSANHTLVQAARAHDDPRLAAAHLARAVLLHHRLLDADRSTKLMNIALAHAGVE